MSRKKFIRIAASALATGTLVVLGAPILLPALGAAGLLGAAGTGTAIVSLSGAALVSASTAVVTGTIAGTTATLTLGGAIVGGALATVANRKRS